MLEEFAGDVFVGLIVLGEFKSDGHHVEAEHAHPTSAVGLFEVAARGEGRGAVENSDIVETEEAALKNIVAVGIFSIDPPGEIKKKLVEDAFKETAVSYASDTAL